MVEQARLFVLGALCFPPRSQAQLGNANGQESSTHNTPFQTINHRCGSTVSDAENRYHSCRDALFNAKNTDRSYRDATSASKNSHRRCGDALSAATNSHRRCGEAFSDAKNTRRRCGGALSAAKNNRSITRDDTSFRLLLREIKKVLPKIRIFGIIKSMASNEIPRTPLEIVVW